MVDNHIKQLARGDTWEHTTGKRYRVLVTNIETRMWGVTNLCEDLVTGEIVPVEDSPEALVNWHKKPAEDGAIRFRCVCPMCEHHRSAEALLNERQEASHGV